MTLPFQLLNHFCQEPQYDSILRGRQVTENGYETLMRLIDVSLEGNEFDVARQYQVLKAAVDALPSERFSEVSDTWDVLQHYFKILTAFQALHWSEGGKVATGCDGFDMDFPSWLAGRGESFLTQFFIEGAPFVNQYIEQNSIPESQYAWECLGYAFHRTNV